MVRRVHLILSAYDTSARFSSHMAKPMAALAASNSHSCPTILSADSP